MGSPGIREGSVRCDLEAPRLGVVLRTAIMVLGFIATDRWYQSVTRLGFEEYSQPSIALALLGNGDPMLYTGLAVLFLLLFFSGTPKLRWADVENGASFQIFAVVLAAVLAWPFVTYGFNFFLDQAHLSDRLLLVALAFLALVRPVFLFPFLLLAYSIMWQLDVPDLRAPIFPHKVIVSQVLTALLVFLVLRASPVRARASDALFMICSIVAGRYWQAGYTKWRLDWLDFGQIHNEIYASYAHGWLGFLSPDQVTAYAGFVARFDGFLGWPVVLLELGALFLLLRRWTSVLILVGAAIFHLGVFALLGFFFWTWIVVDLAVIGLLLRSRDETVNAIYTPLRLALSIPLIAGASFWNNPPALGWFDTVLSYTYRVDVIGESGQEYVVPPRFIEPYGDSFVFSFFHYLTPDHATLTGPYAVTTDRTVANAIAAAERPEDIFALETAGASGSYGDPERAEVFYAFLATYMKNWNARCCQRPWWRVLQPPAQFWSSPRADQGRPWSGEERVTEIIVSEVTSWFDGREIRQIRLRELRQIEVK